MESSQLPVPSLASLFAVLPGWRLGLTRLDFASTLGVAACPALPECFSLRRYQQILHRNLVYLATIADSNQNMQSLLPAVGAAASFNQFLCVSPQVDR